MTNIPEKSSHKNARKTLARQIILMEYAILKDELKRCCFTCTKLGKESNPVRLSERPQCLEEQIYPPDILPDQSMPSSEIIVGVVNGKEDDCHRHQGHEDQEPNQPAEGTDQVVHAVCFDLSS